jgi:error-prone DNA polymerase
MRLAMDLARELIGTPRHLSQHPGGFVLTHDRLDELVPIEPAAMKDRQVIEWDKDDIDALKFMKVDVLALGMLSCMKRGLDLLAERSPFKCGLTSFSALATIAASVQSPQRHPKSRSGSARPARRCACGRCGRLG